MSVLLWIGYGAMYKIWGYCFAVVILLICCGGLALLLWMSGGLPID
jgi:hypothetical protein